MTAKANAEILNFSYTFEGTQSDVQPWAPGSKLVGRIDGTIDPMNQNRVTINSFVSVSLSRPGKPLHTFASIESNEFNTFPSGDTPVMYFYRDDLDGAHPNFNGEDLNFRVCPSGAKLALPTTRNPPSEA